MFHADSKQYGFLIHIFTDNDQCFANWPSSGYYRKHLTENISIIVTNLTRLFLNPWKLVIKTSKELFRCRDELIKSMETGQGWKKHKKTTLHLLHIQLFQLNVSCNRCRVVFLGLFHPCLVFVLFISLSLHVNNFSTKIFITSLSWESIQ